MPQYVCVVQYNACPPSRSSGYPLPQLPLRLLNLQAFTHLYI